MPREPHRSWQHGSGQRGSTEVHALRRACSWAASRCSAGRGRRPRTAVQWPDPRVFLLPPGHGNLVLKSGTDRVARAGGGPSALRPPLAPRVTGDPPGRSQRPVTGGNPAQGERQGWTGGGAGCGPLALPLARPQGALRSRGSSGGRPRSSRRTPGTLWERFQHRVCVISWGRPARLGGAGAFAPRLRWGLPGVLLLLLLGPCAFSLRL